MKLYDILSNTQTVNLKRYIDSISRYVNDPIMYLNDPELYESDIVQHPMFDESMLDTFEQQRTIDVWTILIDERDCWAPEHSAYIEKWNLIPFDYQHQYLCSHYFKRPGRECRTCMFRATGQSVATNARLTISGRK